MPSDDTEKKKKFEKPDSGEFIGVIGDIVDLGIVKTKFRKKHKVRIVWILNANDLEGRPYRVTQQANISTSQNSTLYKIVRDILGEAPPLPYNFESLIGTSKRLFIVKEETRKRKSYVSVRVILPLGSRQPMTVPDGFVRKLLGG